MSASNHLTSPLWGRLSHMTKKILPLPLGGEGWGEGEMFQQAGRFSKCKDSEENLKQLCGLNRHPLTPALSPKGERERVEISSAITLPLWGGKQ